jgi:hypothetical protein
MRQEISGLQKVKSGIHTAQALLIFVIACITIAVFTGSGKTGGGSKWLFAVVSCPPDPKVNKALTSPSSVLALHSRPDIPRRCTSLDPSRKRSESTLVRNC